MIGEVAQLLLHPLALADVLEDLDEYRRAFVARELQLHLDNVAAAVLALVRRDEGDRLSCSPRARCSGARSTSKLARSNSGLRSSGVRRRGSSSLEPRWRSAPG